MDDHLDFQSVHLIFLYCPNSFLNRFFYHLYLANKSPKKSMAAVGKLAQASASPKAGVMHKVGIFYIKGNLDAVRPPFVGLGDW
jgi:hypothetical protein